MDEHISQEDYPKAFKSGYLFFESFPKENQEEIIDNICADFWLRYGLAVRRIDPRDQYADWIEDRMKTSKGFNDWIWGDWLREKAIGAIRLNLLHEAVDIMEKVVVLHADDPDRMAAAKSVFGAIFYGEGWFDPAVDALREAQKSWDEIGKTANKSWVWNNRFCLLKAMVASGKYDKETISELANKILSSGDCNLLRLKRARRIAKGELFNRFDDTVDMIKNVVT